MGGIGKAIGKVMEIAKPFVSMINPAIGMAMGLAGDLLQGKNPLKSILSAATSMIPGGSVLSNVLGKFAGGSLMEGAGGNSLLNAALGAVTGNKSGGITDVLSSLFKHGGEQSAQGTSNAGELASFAMSKLFQ